MKDIHPGLPPDGHPDFARAFIEALPGEADSDGMGFLALAASLGVEKSLPAIALLSRETVHHRDDFGRTPLANSVIVSSDAPDNPGVVRTLLSMGSSPLAADENDYLPVHHAAVFNRHLSVRVLLLASPSCALLATRHGATPLLLAANSDSSQALAAILPFSNPETLGPMIAQTFVLASRAGPETLAHMIPHADTSFRDANGRSPLHMCAHSYAGADNIKTLLDLGFDPMALDNRGETPLLAAIHRQNDRALLNLIPALPSSVFDQRTMELVIRNFPGISRDIPLILAARDELAAMENLATAAPRSRHPSV